MNEILKQIEVLAKQIEVLTSQVTVSEEQNDKSLNIDLYLQEAAEAPFKFHEVADLDEYVKSQYMRMLLTIFDYTTGDLENRYKLVTKIYTGLKMETNFFLLLQQSKKLTVADVREFVSIGKEYTIIPHFIVDLLMLTSMQQETELVQYVSDLVAAFSITEQDFKQYCQLATAILEVNHDEIYEYLITHRQLRNVFGHYLMVIESNFAPEIVIEGNGAEVININKLHTKRLHLKNVCIEIMPKYSFEKYEYLTIENCTLQGSHVTLRFNNIGKLCLNNIKFAKTKKISTIHITNCEEVRMENLKMRDLEIHGKYFNIVKNVKKFVIKDCLFEKIELSERNFADVTFIKANKVENVIKQNVKINKCKNGNGFNSVAIRKIL